MGDHDFYSDRLAAKVQSNFGATEERAFEPPIKSDHVAGVSDF
jgi:hypothetical protein